MNNGIKLCKKIGWQYVTLNIFTGKVLTSVQDPLDPDPRIHASD
jgi:hypothetical protein